MSRRDYTATKVARAEIAAHVATLLRRHVQRGEFGDFLADTTDPLHERRLIAAMDRLRTQLTKAAAATKEPTDG